MTRPHVLRTAHAALRTRNLRLAVYPNVRVSMAPSSLVEGPGRLHLGPRWDGQRYLPSEFSMAAGAKLTVQGNFRVYTGLHISVARGAHLTLGGGFINGRVSLDCFDRISIGDGVLISNGVTIRDSDNHQLVGAGPVAAPITIGDHVWIGVNATVLKSVRIGTGAVVAAGAIVTKDVSDGTLVGGVPARVIRENVKWVP